MDINNANNCLGESEEKEAEQNSHNPTPNRCIGGWRAIRYILANETFEKLASMSLISNLVLYLHTMYNLDNVVSADVFNIWSGTSNMAPLLGAFLADAYLGKFRIILFGSLASFLGLTTMTLTAGIPNLRPSSCDGQSYCQQPRSWQLAVLYLGLGLIAIGAGGIRPCNIAFGADQFDTTTEKGITELESFCNWWYFLFTISLLMALTLVVYVQTNVSWVLGFIIPTACFALSISIFLIGRHTYILVKPQGSIFTNLLKVISAACRKRSDVAAIEKTCQEYSFYDPTRKLVPTKRLCFFDKAAIITDPNYELDKQGKPKNGWRLCSVQQVEELKCVIGIIPVWVTGIGCFLSMQQVSSFGILQAIQTNRDIGKHFKVPPAWLSLTPMIALSIWIFFYESIYVPLMKKRTNKDKRLTMETRIRTGIVMSVLCMVVAGITEMTRKKWALKNGTFESPISFVSLMPEFALSGLTEAFAAIAILEFLTTGWPESLRTMAGAVFFLSASLASYLSSLLIKIVIKISGINGKYSPWLGGNDLNSNKLDYYFYTIAAFGVLNLIYFQFYARHCLEAREKSSRNDLEDVERGSI